MAIASGQASFPELYEQALVGPLFRPFAELLVGEAGLAPGARVLDIACGTGIVARLAAARVGPATVVGVDVSPPMLAVARGLEPEIDWREGEAAALPLRDGEQFDVAFCQQGMQFFPDRAAAAREMHRALAPGGRVLVSTWRADDEMPPLRELRRVAERRLGPISDRRHSLDDPRALEDLLREAGLRDVRSKTASRRVRFEDGSTYVRMNAMALVGMSARGKDMDDKQRAQAIAAVVEESSELAEFELLANVVSGMRAS